MADKKISALTAATTPLAGTEVLPIVQSASTVKVAVNDMLGVTSWTSPAVNSEGNMFLRATDTLGTGVGTQIGLGGKYNASSYFPFAAVAGRKENATNNNVAGYLSFLTTTSGGTLTERARFNSTGNLAFSTAGNGIDFSANGGDVLSQYDEGTYTPVITASSSDPTVTYTRQRGKYVRVGNVVTISVDLIWSAISGGSGDVRLSLPFAGESSVGASGAGPIAVLDGVTFAALRTFCSVQPQASVLYANLPQAGSAVSTTNTTVAQLSASGRFVLSCTYLV
jgi:hypothetical protein